MGLKSVTFVRRWKILLQTFFSAVYRIMIFSFNFSLPVLYLGNLRSFIPFVIIPQLPFVYGYSYITYGNLVSTSQTNFDNERLGREQGYGLY